MPWITFIKDVKPEGDDNATPLYKRGDSHDVSESIAKTCVRDGVAELGQIEVAAPAEAIEPEPVTPPAPAFRPRSSRALAKKQTYKKTAE